MLPPVAGLNPRSPVIDDVGMLEMSDAASTAKFDVDPKATGVNGWVCAAAGMSTAAMSSAVENTMTRCLIDVFFSVHVIMILVPQ
jgi:hypothetical protein